MNTNYLYLFIVAVMLSACGESTTEQSSAAGADSTQVVEEVNPLADFKFHTMIANLPSPLQTFNTMSTVKMDVSNAPLTSIDAAGGLTTQDAKAYGYGMYITDMGLMAYQQNNQEALKYLQTCRTLAENLGAGSVFDQTISANFEQSTGDQEKFVRMMDDAFNAMDQYMVDNERFVNATEIFIGSWIESQLVATSILKNATYNEETKPVYEGVFAQKKHASDLMNVLAEIEAFMDPEVVTAVEEIMMTYAGVSSPEAINAATLSDLETRLNALKTYILK